MHHLAVDVGEPHFPPAETDRQPLVKANSFQFTAESGFLNFAYCCRTTPEQAIYDPAMVVNGHSRPTHTPNLWVSAANSFAEPEWLELNWQSPRSVGAVQLLFDFALHFHFWQSWQGYPANTIPSIVCDYRVIAKHSDGSTTVIADVTGNYHRNRRHECECDEVLNLRIEILRTNGLPRAQLYSIRALEQPPSRLDCR